MNGFDKNAEEFQQDWYGILDCTYESTTSQIQKAARTFSLKYHPDKNPDPDAAAMFLLVQKAKDILMDETKRRIIDTYYKQKADIVASKAKRDANMDSNRKRMRDVFEENLKKAEESKVKLSHEEVLHNEIRKRNKIIEKLRKQNAGLQEDAAESLHKQAYEKAKEYEKLRKAQLDSELNLVAASQVKIKWKRSAESHSEESLYQLFKIYGDIDEVTLSATKGTSAVITYKKDSYARAAVTAYANSEEYKVSSVSAAIEKSRKAAIFSHDYSKGSTLNSTYSSTSSLNNLANMYTDRNNTEQSKFQQEVSRAVELEQLEQRLAQLQAAKKTYKSRQFATADSGKTGSTVYQLLPLSLRRNYRPCFHNNAGEEILDEAVADRVKGYTMQDAQDIPPDYSLFLQKENDLFAKITLYEQGLRI